MYQRRAESRFSSKNHELPLTQQRKKKPTRLPRRRKRRKLSSWFSSLLVISVPIGVVLYLCFLLGAHVKPNKRVPRPPPRPFAYPADGLHVSVVLMNYGRPGVLRRSALMPILLNHPAVSEILLCHANPKTAFTWDHPKVKNMDAAQLNAEVGLALRFHYCAAAENDWVIHVDDDMELDDSAINEMISAMVEEPHRIVGHYARSYNYWKVPHRHGYEYATTLTGPAEVILTKVMIMEKIICRVAEKDLNLMSDMALSATPMWNGEDIFASLVANHYYSVGKNGPWNNYALPNLNVWEADNTLKDDDVGTTDISSNMDRHSLWKRGVFEYLTFFWRSLWHSAYRGRFWATAKHRLATLDV